VHERLEVKEYLVKANLGLYKILFLFAVSMWESIMLLLPPPTCIARTIAIPLHVYCARYDAPPTPPWYAIHYTILVRAISCKFQDRTQQEEATRCLPRIRVNPSTGNSLPVESYLVVIRVS